MNFRDSEIEQRGRHLGRRNMALKSLVCRACVAAC